MKAGTLDHPKFRALARRLGLPRAYVAGLLEATWHMARAYAPDGGVGRFSNAALADFLGVADVLDADALVDALVAERWLDPMPEPVRLYVHDWHEHADDAVQRAVARARGWFANGAAPSLGRLGGRERDEAAAFYAAHEPPPPAEVDGNPGAQRAPRGRPTCAPPRPAPPRPAYSSERGEFSAGGVPSDSPPPPVGEDPETHEGARTATRGRRVPADGSGTAENAAAGTGRARAGRSEGVGPHDPGACGQFEADALPPRCLADHMPATVREAARAAGCSNPTVCVRHMVAFYRGLPSSDPRRLSADWQSRAVAWFAGHGTGRRACRRGATDADAKRERDGRERERRATQRMRPPTDTDPTDDAPTAPVGRLSDALAAALEQAATAAGKGK